MLRLKEHPREWQKFTAVMGIAANVLAWLLWWRGYLPKPVPISIAILATLALLTSLIRPGWFRGFYRGGMTVSFHIGQTIGKVLLTVFFFLFVTPMGWALRLSGKDLLQLTKRSARESYWHKAKNSRDFDRMF